MCGITGAAWTEPHLAVSRDVLERMARVLGHRGPDEQGSYVSDLHIVPPYPAVPGVALGHTRLSIIDPAGSRQPLTNEDGNVQVIFNGEIYNYRDLRHRLEGSGHKFRTEGDTEVLVHLYEDEGPEFVKHLIGMFALVIWDAANRRLVLARDRLGQKPLVYRLELGRLSFASELKSLLEVPGAPREVDPSALDEYLLYQYVPYPNSILRGYRKLPPAHTAVFHDGKLTLHRYWQPDPNHEEPLSADVYARRLRTVLDEAVSLRLVSDVPLGAFLSGGVDSSVVVALAQRHLAEPLKTFSVGFPQAEYDETSFARRVAAHVGTDHHEFRVDPQCVDVLEKLIWHFDEPLADSSAMATYYLAQQTRDHVKVALSGDGGDELFAGYRRYQAMVWASRVDRLPKPLRGLVANRLWQRLPAPGRQKSLRRQFRRLAEVLATSPERRYAELVGIFNEARRAALYSDDYLARLPDSDPVDFLASALKMSDKRDVGTQVSLADMVTYLPCDLCHKVDIATMAHGLECRQPLLDHRVAELAMAMPLGLKLRGRRGKRILERATRDLLPRWVYRRRKMGFGVPLDHWFRHELKDLAHDTLLSRQALARGYFREDALRRLLDEHQSAAFDHSARLWSLLVLELWHQQWLAVSP